MRIELGREKEANQLLAHRNFLAGIIIGGSVSVACIGHPVALAAIPAIYISRLLLFALYEAS